MSTKFITRRSLLQSCSLGFGSVALSGMFPGLTLGSESPPPSGAMSEFHHPPKAKRVIFCFMSGGVSHVDSFDPKPMLEKLHGKPMPVTVERTQFNNNGAIMASPFKFTPSGQSGIPVSGMFPEIAKVADELAVVRSMTTSVNEHAQGNFMMHTGFPFMGHPSAGAWAAYGLGSENENLPAFVVLRSGAAVAPHGGVALFSNGFLPGQHQGSTLYADRAEAIQNIAPHGDSLAQRSRLDFVKRFDGRFLQSTSQDPQVEAAIKNAEVAFRMQSAVPELCDISGETAATLKRYGVESKDPLTAAYGRQCLLARRLVERGVRFIELSCLTAGIGAGGAPNPWDQHGKLELGHKKMAEQVDQPISGMIQDLKERGLLDDTLVVWACEFGRTPFSQGSDGRDHNPFGFSIWMAGGGIKGGTIHGATDEFGYRAVENPCTIYDLWATVLHQLGVDHRKLTYRHGGRDFRLTDVHGNVIHKILT
ncbi:DUF1501 domain-containing protein [Blastopirellula sp. JC732]|uniref:DUF1501 domain-containing protein n=1 Tax=Blastopirellula sediminis TaxID=2894196 RepID=A0A9X1MPG5_9BACT|nr:DUF1501 domain-containing protein [Blastopirellula sediminis]MCC9606186.1 DUF1501 domain-containing protein [Blastopirellula sediminis]MCC9630516.1 DUF1501 domain-containing protein [Blastopirellula sediminis]